MTHQRRHLGRRAGVAAARTGDCGPSQGLQRPRARLAWISASVDRRRVDVSARRPRRRAPRRAGAIPERARRPSGIPLAAVRASPFGGARAAPDQMSGHQAGRARDDHESARGRSTATGTAAMAAPTDGRGDASRGGAGNGAEAEGGDRRPGCGDRMIQGERRAACALVERRRSGGPMARPAPRPDQDVPHRHGLAVPLLSSQRSEAGHGPPAGPGQVFAPPGDWKIVAPRRARMDSTPEGRRRTGDRRRSGRVEPVAVGGRVSGERSCLAGSRRGGGRGSGRA